jgi:hypothetical protein
MTRTEILDTLEQLDPTRSYCVTENSWTHSHLAPEECRTESGALFVLPGFGGGKDCTLISVPADAPTLAAALGIVRLHLQPAFVPSLPLL